MPPHACVCVWICVLVFASMCVYNLWLYIIDTYSTNSLQPMYVHSHTYMRIIRVQMRAYKPEAIIGTCLCMYIRTQARLL